MPTSAQIKSQIDGVLVWMIGAGLSDDQNFAFERGGRDGSVEITFRGAEHISLGMKNESYSSIHGELLANRAYSAKLVDGSIIQMAYRFVSGVIEQHRLAFFPVPDLSRLRNDPGLDHEADMYADLLARNVVTVPLRFDYDVASGRELEHPLSHLTLGQYTNCRIPVVAPLTPSVFIEFIARNFYHRAFIRHESEFPPHIDGFEQSILPAERGVLHLAVPGSQP